MATQSVSQDDLREMSFLLHSPPGPHESYDAIFYAADEIPAHLDQAGAILDLLSTIKEENIADGTIQQTALAARQLVVDARAWFAAFMVDYQSERARSVSSDDARLRVQQ